MLITKKSLDHLLCQWILLQLERQKERRSKILKISEDLKKQIK